MPRLSQPQAKAELDIEKSHAEQVSARHTHSSLWLIGSLFALNGAGLLGLASLKEKAATGLSASGALFAIGIVTALLCGLMARQADQRLLRALRERVRVLAEAGKTKGPGTKDEDEAKFYRDKKSVGGLVRWVYGFGLISFAAWLAGLYLTEIIPIESAPPVHRVILECASEPCPG